ncbi:MAG: ribbon-helix-helix domain-containing protein [archaeon]
MATEMITVKLDPKFLRDIDSVVKRSGYQNRTEFIRNALREKVEAAKMKEAMMQLANLKGSSESKTSNEELEKIREKVFKEHFR